LFVGESGEREEGQSVICDRTVWCNLTSLQVNFYLRRLQVA